MCIRDRPVAMHKAGVLEKAAELKDRLVKAGLRVKLDDSDNSMGWKCAQYEICLLYTSALSCRARKLSNTCRKRTSRTRSSSSTT